VRTKGQEFPCHCDL